MHIHNTRGTQKDIHWGQRWQHHQAFLINVPTHVSWLWSIISNLEWIKKQYPSWYGQRPKDSNRHLWRFVPLQEAETTTPSTHTTRGGDVCPELKYKQHQDSPSKQWNIICRWHILPLSAYGTLYRKLTAINILIFLRVTITTGQTHHDTNHNQHPSSWNNQS